EPAVPDTHGHGRDVVLRGGRAREGLDADGGLDVDDVVGVVTVGAVALVADRDGDLVEAVRHRKLPRALRVDTVGADDVAVLHVDDRVEARVDARTSPVTGVADEADGVAVRRRPAVDETRALTGAGAGAERLTEVAQVTGDDRVGRRREVDLHVEVVDGARN